MRQPHLVGCPLPSGWPSPRSFWLRGRPAPTRSWSIAHRPGERLESSPDAIRLRFTEPVVPSSARIELRNSSGKPVDLGPARAFGSGQEVEVLLPRLGDGIYVVAWESVSALDGHLEVGEFAFAVGVRVGSSTLAVRTGGGVAWPETVASWLALVGLMVAGGALASERWVWGPVARHHALEVPGLPVGPLLVAGFLGSLALLLLLLRRAGEGGWAQVIGTAAGQAALIQVAAVSQALVLVRIERTRTWAVALVGLALSAAASRSHAASVSVWWALPTNVMHLMAGALWAGGLLSLAVAAWRLRSDGRPAALAEGARRYASLALAAVAVVLMSGVAVALSQFRDVSQLVTTGYGRVLLLKLSLVATTLVLALAARRWALTGSGEISSRLLRRLVRPEAASLLLVISVATVLANTTPPWAQASRVFLGPPPLRGSVVRLAGLAGSPLAVHVAATEGRLELRVVDPLREPAAGAAIEIDARAPNGTEVGISPRTCGPGCATSTFRWQEGRTELSVSVSSEEWGRGVARFSVPWPPGPERPGLLMRVLRAMREETRIEMTERVSSGLGGVSETTFVLSGEQFAAEELYAAGGATDVRLLPSAADTRIIVAYLPGSSIWFRLQFDGENRLQHETIVSPGHQIERSFRYQEES
jgi:copper transport protein